MRTASFRRVISLWYAAVASIMMSAAASAQNQNGAQAVADGISVNQQSCLPSGSRVDWRDLQTSNSAQSPGVKEHTVSAFSSGIDSTASASASASEKNGTIAFDGRVTFAAPSASNCFLEDTRGSGIGVTSNAFMRFSINFERETNIDVEQDIVVGRIDLTATGDTSRLFCDVLGPNPKNIDPTQDIILVAHFPANGTSGSAIFDLSCGGQYFLEPGGPRSNGYGFSAVTVINIPDGVKCGTQSSKFEQCGTDDPEEPEELKISVLIIPLTRASSSEEAQTAERFREFIEKKIFESLLIDKENTTFDVRWVRYADNIFLKLFAALGKKSDAEKAGVFLKVTRGSANAFSLVSLATASFGDFVLAVARMDDQSIEFRTLVQDTLKAQLPAQFTADGPLTKVKGITQDRLDDGQSVILVPYSEAIELAIRVITPLTVEEKSRTSAVAVAPTVDRARLGNIAYTTELFDLYVLASGGASWNVRNDASNSQKISDLFDSLGHSLGAVYIEEGSNTLDKILTDIESRIVEQQFDNR